jgi:hypothetical protein
VDSAALRAAEAEQKLKDFGEASSKPKAGPLPSALDAFEEVGRLVAAGQTALAA